MIETCLICNGTGQVFSNTLPAYLDKCYTCNGKGYADSTEVSQFSLTFTRNDNCRFIDGYIITASGKYIDVRERTCRHAN